MLGLTLRQEFRGRWLKGTAIELANQNNTGATQIAADEFLRITYPTADVLAAMEAIGPGRGQPVVLIGERGQGKSHLLAALYHALTNPEVTSKWLSSWGVRLGQPKLAELKLRPKTHVISESLQRQNFKFLWDLLFERHPYGAEVRGMWKGQGDKQTDIPGEKLLLELFMHTPTALVLDEFQTWYDGLTNTKQYPWRTWAGLVNNWHRELNEVFRLDFEVFGSEGDVTDRKSNAFSKHDRLIASIDTLKRPARIKRLLEAPPWDLVVFDEAHHLTAFRNGRKITKTENYKLAEALKGHTRDLILLSATPHQGDHFRFWMVIQLLNPTLFKSWEDMVENRHRLNEVVFRRTKADACRPDSSSLFARRWVHTESFTMADEERVFYAALKEYLEDGFALARRQGNKGRALGFVMTIFQKIAASSFAAVRRTLRRRFLMLTLHEAIIKDQELDIDARQLLLDEARELIHEEFEVGAFPKVAMTSHVISST